MTAQCSTFSLALIASFDPLSFPLDRSIELIQAQEKEDQPVAYHEGKPITRGKGRFGPFLKWDGIFVNIPKNYDPATLTEEEIHELVTAKIEKEKNRYIQRWDKEKIALENGRWGPFIRKGRKSISIPKVEGNKISSDQAKELSLDDVKKIIEACDSAASSLWVE